MSWSISQVARMSGVTSRTLRHYHEVGLLEPAWVAHGGRRHYGREELLRLQQILLYRNLGLGLDAISEILERQDPQGAVAVLGRHRSWLVEERKRLGRLLRTVETTMRSLEQGDDMPADRIFEGFEHNPYEAEARERWGDEAVDASKARIQGWTEAEAEQARTGYERVHGGLAPLAREGAAPDDPRVQELVALHHEVTSLFWEPSREAYAGLGRMYVDDERFRANIGEDAVVELLRDAMAVYAKRHLT